MKTKSQRELRSEFAANEALRVAPSAKREVEHVMVPVPARDSYLIRQFNDALDFIEMLGGVR